MQKARLKSVHQRDTRKQLLPDRLFFAKARSDDRTASGLLPLTSKKVSWKTSLPVSEDRLQLLAAQCGLNCFRNQFGMAHQ